MTGATLSIWGSGSGVGKSIVTFGLARAFTNRGLKVRAVKPLVVSDANVWLGDDPRPFNVLDINFATACRHDVDVRSVVVTLGPDDPLIHQDTFSARYTVAASLFGDPRGVGPVHVLEDWLPDARVAIERLIAEARNEADIVLIEGAGSPVDDGQAANLANHYPFLGDEHTGLLVVDCLTGNPFASIAGSVSLLGDRARQLCGYILNRCVGGVPTAPSRFTEAMGAAAEPLGYISAYRGAGTPTNLSLDSATGAVDHLRDDAWFDLVASNVSRNLEIEALMKRVFR